MASLFQEGLGSVVSPPTKSRRISRIATVRCRTDAEAPGEAAIELLDGHDVRARRVRFPEGPAKARADTRAKIRLRRAPSLRAIRDAQGGSGRLGARDRGAGKHR